MKTIRIILAAWLSIAMIACMMFSTYAADGDSTKADELLASKRWATKNLWEFTTDLTDSVGGAVAKKLEDTTFWVDPTYSGGKIILNGTAAYTFETPLDFTETADYKYLRIDIRAKMDFTAPAAAHRIFGSNDTLAPGTKNFSGLYFATFNQSLSGVSFVSPSFGLATNSSDHYSHYFNADATKFDQNAMNKYTFIFADGVFYTYVNDVLINEKQISSVGTFVFTDFLGCSYVLNTPNHNFYGEIDYIRTAMMGEEEVEQPVIDEATDAATTAPDTTAADTDTTAADTTASDTANKDTTNADTSAAETTSAGETENGDYTVAIIIAAVAVVVIVVALILVKLKKKH